jgi:hypothetical protein
MDGRNVHGRIAALRVYPREVGVSIKGFARAIPNH